MGSSFVCFVLAAVVFVLEEVLLERVLLHVLLLFFEAAGFLPAAVFFFTVLDAKQSASLFFISSITEGSDLLQPPRLLQNNTMKNI